MLIAWGDIVPMAALTGVITPVLLLLYRLWKKELSLAHSVGLAIVGAIGFVIWFTIFNVFSLSSLNQDLPIPLFPVSPEDICCAITVGLIVLLYDWLVSMYRKNRKGLGLSLRTELGASLLPIIVALVIDVYFI